MKSSWSFLIHRPFFQIRSNLSSAILTSRPSPGQVDHSSHSKILFSLYPTRAFSDSVLRYSSIMQNLPHRWKSSLQWPTFLLRSDDGKLPLSMANKPMQQTLLDKTCNDRLNIVQFWHLISKDRAPANTKRLGSILRRHQVWSLHEHSVGVSASRLHERVWINWFLPAFQKFLAKLKSDYNILKTQCRGFLGFWVPGEVVRQEEDSTSQRAPHQNFASRLQLQKNPVFEEPPFVSRFWP